MENVKNGLYGFVIGDAMGVPIEFTGRVYDESQKLKDMVGYGSHHVPAGTWSDDTSMTIATMDSMQEKGGIDYCDIMDKFLAWATKSKYTNNGKLFDIGNTTSRALSKYMHNKDNPILCGETGERSNGNGSLMRMLPIALYLYNKDYTEDEELEIIKNISSLTHAHEISVMACKIYVDYLKQIMSGNDKMDSYQEICKKDYNSFFSKETVDKYQKILSGKLQNESINNIVSSGYVISTLESVIWSILNTENYEESIILSINLGHDTDTIGAITGSISGIMYGYESIPQRWLDELKGKDYLNKLIANFEELLTDGRNNYR